MHLKALKTLSNIKTSLGTIEHIYYVALNCLKIFIFASGVKDWINITVAGYLFYFAVAGHQSNNPLNGFRFLKASK